MTKEDIKTLTEIILDTQTQVADQLSAFKLGIDARLVSVDARLDALEESNAELVKKADRTLDLLDGIASRISDDDTERMALSAQVTRHEDWIVAAAPVVNVKYVPGA